MYMKLVELIESKSGKEFRVELLTKTLVKLNKKSKDGVMNPFDAIYKISKQTVVLNKKYEEAVNEKLTDKGVDTPFVAKSRVWGNTEGCFVHKGDSVYLAALVEKSETLEYQDGDGVIVSKSDFLDYMPTQKVQKPQEGLSLDEAVVYRNFKIESIIDFVLI